MRNKIIYLGSDHAGFEMKEKLKAFLQKKKIHYTDLTPEKKEGDDYPDIAFSVGELVAENSSSRGILFCGSGTGMCIGICRCKA